MKKLLAMLLAVAMVLGLAACGSKAPAATEPAATEPAAPAAESALDPVTLRVWFHGSNVTPDASAKVMESLNPILQEKLNVTLEPIWGTWGDFDTATTTDLQGGATADIYFTCNWSGNEYNKYARDGYWVKLDDMLDTYAPELKALIPEAIWNSAVTNGIDGEGIYGVPGLKDTATSNCWDVNGALLEELGYNIDDVKANGLDYFSAEFEEMMQKAKDAKGADFYPLLIEPAVLERMVTVTAIVTGDLNGANVLSYYYDAEHPSKDIGSKIVNKYGTEEFKAFAEKTYEYAQKGFISPECQNTETANDYRTACQTKAEYLFGTQSYSYGWEKDGSVLARGNNAFFVPSSAPYMDATSGQGAMMAISATSANPERALMFLNLLNTDSEVMTMLNLGVEGYTYTKNDDGTITMTDAYANEYHPWTNGMGNVRLLPATADQGLGFYEEFAKFYESAEATPMGTYIFDSSDVSSAAATVSNVYAKYAMNLMSGAVDPATELPKFLEELDAAGINEIVDAANAQLDAFLAG